MFFGPRLFTQPGGGDGRDQLTTGKDGTLSFFYCKKLPDTLLTACNRFSQVLGSSWCSFSDVKLIGKG